MKIRCWPIVSIYDQVQMAAIAAELPIGSGETT